MAASMTIDQILRDLNYCDNEFPEAAWEAALERRDEIIPKLTEAIEDAASKVDDDQIVATWGHVAALFLLTELDAKAEFPVIMKSMCCSEPDELYGGFISEELPRIAARLADSPDMLAETIDDSYVDDFVRIALIAAIFGMVCEKRISRDEAILFLLDRMDMAADHHDIHVMTACVEMLGQLAAEEASLAVRRAVDTGFVDEEVIGIDYFEKQLARGQQAFDEACGCYMERRILTASEYLQQLPRFDSEIDYPTNLEETLVEIQESPDALPSDAIRWARKHRDEITPHLIRMIDQIAESFGNHDGEHATENDIDDDPRQGMGHIIALYLLTEFDAREALPAILRAVSHPVSQVIDRFQDVISLDLAQMLGRLADSPEQLKPIADDPDVDGFVRRDAVDAVVWMVTEGKLDRSKAIELLRSRFHESCEWRDAALSTWIACSLMDLGASDARASIVDACESGKLDDDWLWTDAIDEMLAEGNDSFTTTCENYRKDRIEHTVVELEGWDWVGFRSEGSDSDDDWDDEDDDDEDDDSDDEEVILRNPEFSKMFPGLRQRYSDSELFQLLQEMPKTVFLGQRDEDDSFSSDTVAPIRNAEPKVGRNDPCPCGSGRKHKKCCARADN